LNSSSRQANPQGGRGKALAARLFNTIKRKHGGGKKQKEVKARRTEGGCKFSRPERTRLENSPPSGGTGQKGRAPIGRKEGAEEGLANPLLVRAAKSRDYCVRGKTGEEPQALGPRY